MKKLFIYLTILAALLTALFGLASCGQTVEFNVNFIVDGETYSTVGTGGEEVIAIPENPTKEGYTFDGWYWDKDTWQTPFTANSLLDAPLSSDMNVYAKWKENEPPLPDLQGVEIRSKALTLTEDTLKVTLSNATETFSFLNDITVADGASYVIARDIGCEQTIASKTVSLEAGDNVYYILVTNGNEQKLYTATVRRHPMYTVTFNTNGGTPVASQTVEEGNLATAPTTTRAGYTFASWNYDFSQPVISSVTVSASWNANTNTPYKVEYYLENLDKNGYDKVETLNLTGTTDTTANAEIRTYEHFTYNAIKSNVSGKIDGNGSKVLRVYYTRNTYRITTAVSDSLHGSVVSGGTYAYGKQITLTASTSSGYSVTGWKIENDTVCSSATYSFTVDKSANIVAIISPNTNTPYKVEYYLENLDKNGYDKVETLNLTGTTDTTATAEIKTYEHFTYNSSKSTVSGTISGNGKKVLRVYYTRNTYTVTTSVSDSNGGTITGGGTYPYGKSVTIKATPYQIYNLVCYYVNGVQIAGTSSYTFIISENTTVSATFEVEPALESFTYTATPTTCTITGIKDKTVKNIVVPECVTSIGDAAFLDCDTLTSMTIGNGVTSIGKYAFYYCESLTSVTIPNSVTSIGISAFAYCTKLTSVTIPNSVTSIGYAAFSSCDSLTSVTIPNSVTSIGYAAFSSCDSLTSITVSTDNVAYKSIDGNLYTKDGKTLIQYAIGKTDTSFTIPTSVTNIGNGAFESCDSLTSVTIPNSVTSIGNDAFYSCDGLTSITIPNSVTSIGNYAFNNCHNLTSVTIGNGVTSIGNDAFGWCTSLTSVTIPNSVTSIGNDAFWECDSLTSVTIGNGVTSIGNSAFYDCDNLTSINYRGTQAQWNAITKEYDWDYGTGNYTITYNYTGE